MEKCSFGCQRFRLLAFSFNEEMKTSLMNPTLYQPWPLLEQPLWGLSLAPEHDASSHFYCAYSDLALPSSLVACPAYKTPGTLARPTRHRCRETSVHGTMDRRSYAYANLNFQMGLYLLSQPQALLPEMWNLLRYNDVASSITHSMLNCFPILAGIRTFCSY